MKLTMKKIVSPVNSLNPLRPGRVAPRDQTDPALETDGVSKMGWNGRPNGIPYLTKPTMDRPGHHGTSQMGKNFQGRRTHRGHKELHMFFPMFTVPSQLVMLQNDLNPEVQGLSENGPPNPVVNIG